MQLIKLVQEVIQTGVLSMAVEQQIDLLLKVCPIDEQISNAIDQLVDALCDGSVRSVP